MVHRASFFLLAAFALIAITNAMPQTASSAPQNQPNAGSIFSSILKLFETKKQQGLGQNAAGQNADNQNAAGPNLDDQNASSVQYSDSTTIDQIGSIADAPSSGPRSVASSASSSASSGTVTG